MLAKWVMVPGQCFSWRGVLLCRKDFLFLVYSGTSLASIFFLNHIFYVSCHYIISCFKYICFYILIYICLSSVSVSVFSLLLSGVSIISEQQNLQEFCCCWGGSCCYGYWTGSCDSSCSEICRSWAGRYWPFWNKWGTWVLPYPYGLLFQVSINHKVKKLEY